MSQRDTLAETLVNYAAMRDIKQSTLEFYERVVRGFELWLGRPATVADLDGDTISQFLIERKQGTQASYRRNLRNALKALQTFAGQSGVICRVRVTAPMVQGNTAEELATMRDVSWRLDVMDHPPVIPCLRSVYFRAWLTLLFESCVRPSDVHRILRARCRPDKPFGFQAEKNGEVVTIKLTKLCCRLIDLLPEHNLAVPPIVSCEVLRDWLRKTSEWSGVEYYSRYGIRRTAGTAAEIAEPGTGHLALGNTRQVFNRSYKIKSQIQSTYHGPGGL